MSEIYFDHEKLKIYQKTLEFINWSGIIYKEIKFKFSVIDQFYRAFTSILLNIAEGNGKYSNKDRCRYFDMQSVLHLNVQRVRYFIYQKNNK